MYWCAKTVFPPCHRPASKDVGRASKGLREKLWVCSKEPLKQPLMNSLARNSELSTLACNAYTDILETNAFLF